MTIRLQTNPTGQIARQNFSANVFFLSDSVQKLSSGLRVNKTAEDPVAVSLASQLDSRSRGLGQAARNANDGVAAMQVVDSSLTLGMEILATVLTKVQTATRDDLTTRDRSVLQSDIGKLLTELEQLVDGTTYHDLPLLNGSYTNKAFQVGALPGEIVSATLPGVSRYRIGQVATGELTITAPRGGQVNLRLENQANDQALAIGAVTLAQANDPGQGMAALAQAINAHAESTGISARAVVASQSTAALTVGTTPDSFAVNGVRIGAVAVQNGDSDVRLRNAINAKSASHGVVAEVTSTGNLQLTARDGRPIAVSGSAGAVGFSDAEMTTFGYTRILQSGPYHLNLTDSAVGLAVAFSPTLHLAAPMVTTIDSTLTRDSILGSSSTLAAGWSAGLELTGADLQGDIATTQSSTLNPGSVLAMGSVLAPSSTLGGGVTLDALLTTTQETVLRSGSLLLTGSVISQGSYLTNAVVSTGGPVAAGQILAADATLANDLTLTRDMLLFGGSSLAAGSALAQASRIGGEVTLAAPLTVSEEMTMASGSLLRVLDGETKLTAGSLIGGQAHLAAGDLQVTEAMVLKAGSSLSASSELALGSTIGGAALLAGDHGVSFDLYLAGGSIIAAGSTIKSGTTLTNGVTTTSGAIVAGTTIQHDLATTGGNTLTLAMTLRQGSVLAHGSTLAAQSQNESAVTLSGERGLGLHEISVQTKDDAAIAVAVTEAAMAEVERIRRQAVGIGEQLTGLAAVQATGSDIMDTARAKMVAVDFMAEAENYTRMEMLIRTSSFALTQANAVPINVFGIMQGGNADKANQFFINSLNRMLTAGAVI
jgi:flagellin